MKARGVFRADGGDGLFHALDIGGCEQLTAGAEDEPVLRVQAGHGDFLVEIVAGGGEDLAQHLRIKKEGRTDVEAKAVPLHGGGAPAYFAALLDNRDLNSGFCKQNGRCEAAGSCSYDDGTPRFGVH